MAKNVYTSVACNRTPDCADWGRNGLILFGASNAVAVLDPKFDGNSAKILHTYVMHTKRVNTVHWLCESTNAPEQHFLSGADDGLAILWNIADPNTPTYYLLKGHECGVNAVSGLQMPEADRWLVATAGADCAVRLWKFDGERYVNFQQVALNGGYCMALQLTMLPKTNALLLAMSLDDATIALYAQAPLQREQSEPFRMFQQLHRLSGHEDWVRSLDFVSEGDDVLLASGGQDNFIRLWRFAPRTEEQVLANSVDIFDMMDDVTGELRLEEKVLHLSADTWYAVSLESVLYGHEGWVYGVQWHKSDNGALRLLSASIDKTLIIWAPTEDGVWMEQVRVGDVGGNSVGFFGGKFAAHGKSILGHSYQGGFHIWNQASEVESMWTPNVVVAGHFGEVRDLAWAPQGEYLMSVSADQTTRIHAPWRRTELTTSEITWHELARPQVHGYDMQALAILSRYKFASGAEEKIVRTFETSANFIENFRRITQIEKDEEGDILLLTLPKGASVPSLGLSNKAVYNVDNAVTEERHVKDEYPENYFVPVTLNMPPQEETLMQNTLWPEVQKLYGHGFEIYSLAASADGSLLASACRATNAEHASIILWNTKTWKQIQKLASHQLTVVQMCFSPNGRYLLSVSRDRRWSLFEQQSISTEYQLPIFNLVASTNKINGLHTRIIWACDWSHDNKLFATVSRDGKAIIWTQSKAATLATDSKQASLNGWYAVDVLELKNESITAVAFAKRYFEAKGVYLLALGFENGLIRLYRFDDKWAQLMQLNNDQAHHLTVKRLQFRPYEAENANQFQLASCGDDHLVRIIELNM